MAMIGIRCSKCKETTYYKGNQDYMKDYYLSGKRLICKKCYKNKN